MSGLEIKEKPEQRHERPHTETLHECSLQVTKQIKQTKITPTQEEGKSESRFAII